MGEVRWRYLRDPVSLESTWYSHVKQGLKRRANCYLYKRGVSSVQLESADGMLSCSRLWASMEQAVCRIAVGTHPDMPAQFSGSRQSLSWPSFVVMPRTAGQCIAQRFWMHKGPPKRLQKNEMWIRFNIPSWGHFLLFRLNCFLRANLSNSLSHWVVLSFVSTGPKHFIC